MPHFLPLLLRPKTASRAAGARREDPHPAGCWRTCLASPQAGCEEPGSNWRHPSAAPAPVTGVSVTCLPCRTSPCIFTSRSAARIPVPRSAFPSWNVRAGVRDQHPPRAGQGRAGRESWLQFQLGVVPFQQLRGINCLARAPRLCSWLLEGWNRFLTLRCVQFWGLGLGGGGSRKHIFGRSEANWLVKSAIEKFLLLRSGISCTAGISKDEGA